MGEPLRDNVQLGEIGSAAAAVADVQPHVRSTAKAFDILWLFVVCSFVFVALTIFRYQPLDVGVLWPVVLFLAIAVASELLPVVLPDGNAEITLTNIIIWAVVALFGPSYGVITIFLAVSLGSFIHKRVLTKPDISNSEFWRYLIYNSCEVGLTVGIGGLAFAYLGGVPLVARSGGEISFAQVAAPLFAATFITLSLDVLFYTVGSAVSEATHAGESSIDGIWMRAKVQWLKNALGFLPSYIMFTPFAFVLAYLFVWRNLGFWGILPILVPFFSVRHMLIQFVESVRAYRQTITTLATLMQKYHPYTRGHLKRVADLSLRLARELKLPAASQQWIWEAGLLHDIGKVSVPEHVLDKIGKLTDEEWEIIKAHPVKSADILEQMEFLDPIVPWVRHHHERVDGGGYPGKLTNDDIPLEAAIIAVADAFDAMTGSRDIQEGKFRDRCDACDWKPENGDTMPEVCPDCGATVYRVYRQPLSIEAAISQLRYGVGTQFSPRVVRAFLRMIAREGLNGPNV